MDTSLPLPVDPFKLDVASDLAEERTFSASAAERRDPLLGGGGATFGSTLRWFFPANVAAAAPKWCCPHMELAKRQADNSVI